MITAFLAGNGGHVLIPDAVAVVAEDSDPIVRFVDADGRTLVVFRRQDVALYSKDGAHPELESNEAEDPASVQSEPIFTDSE